MNFIAEFSHSLRRRTFLSTTVKAAGATILLKPLTGHTESLHDPQKTYTVQDIMDIVLKEIPEAPLKDTVDTLKAGTASQEVTGIVTTMFATVDLIRKAAALNANFIIAHEPSFYNHLDDPAWVADNDIVRRKQELLKQHGMAVWRLHDYWHTYKPDGIMHGVLMKTGWLRYYTGNDPIFSIPSMPLKNIVSHLKESLGIKTMRIIGDAGQSCSKIALLPGAWGGQRQVSAVRDHQPDVLIVGELQEWETAEYIRDARAFGSKVALIVLGHAVSEEPGMEWFARWLQPKVPGLKITHLESGSPFKWI